MNNQFKDGDTFYYPLKRFYTTEDGRTHLQFNVFSYNYCKKYNHCFDQSLMFTTREKAELKAIELNRTVGY